MITNPTFQIGLNVANEKNVHKKSSAEKVGTQT